MNTDFKDIMSKRTDAELIKIITVDKGDYQPAAIVAAEQEIKNRGIDTTTIEKVRIDLTSKIDDKKQFNENRVSASTRFINFILDTIAFYTLSIVLSLIVNIFVNTNTDQSILTILSYLVLAISFFSYYVFMETKYQKTLGKFITKTKVVTKDGLNPDMGDIIRRTFCRLIPLDRLSYLLTKNGFHDRLSDTDVIKDEY